VRAQRCVLCVCVVCCVFTYLLCTCSVVAEWRRVLYVLCVCVVCCVLTYILCTSSVVAEWGSECKRSAGRSAEGVGYVVSLIPSRVGDQRLPPEAELGGMCLMYRYLSISIIHLCNLTYRPASFRVEWATNDCRPKLNWDVYNR